jgi:hypothetical protein
MAAAALAGASIALAAAALPTPPASAAPPGTAQAEPAVAANADGRMEMFVVGTGGRLWFHSQTSPGAKSWTTWKRFDGTFSSIAAGTNSDGRIELFGTDGSRRVYHRWQERPDSGDWSEWTAFGGRLPARARLGVARDTTTGRLTVFATSDKGRLYSRGQQTIAEGGRQGTWSAWTAIDGVAGAAAAKAKTGGTADLAGEPWATLPSLSPPDLPFASAIVRATHNSFSGNLASGSRGSILTQLDSGVRFLELDITEDAYGTWHDYQIGHGSRDTEVDHAGGNPASDSLREWLDEIADWSTRNPDHAPLVVMLDIRNDFANNTSFANGDPTALNEELKNAFGSSLVLAKDFPDQLPTINSLRGRVITLLSGDSNTRWGYRRDGGQNPSVAINAHGQVVEVHDSGGGLWFWSGQIQGNGRVSWQRHGKFDTGTTAAVALNDNGMIVEVHKAENVIDNSLWYSVGRLAGNGDITWGAAHKYDTGVLPTIQFVDSAGTTLREIHRSQANSQNWDWNATLNSSDFTVGWAGNGTTSDPRYDSTTAKNGGLQIHVWAGPDGTSSGSILQYSTPTMFQDWIRYDQVAYVDTQPGDSVELQNGALFYSAPASDTEFIASNRSIGHIVRGWDFDSTDEATDPLANEPATNHPYDPWYHDLLSRPDVVQ